jgi:hypothetical protein
VPDLQAAQISRGVEKLRSTMQLSQRVAQGTHATLQECHPLNCSVICERFVVL